MPQMAPYNWLMLFFIFNMIMIFLTSTNYFIYQNMNSNPLHYYLNNLKFKWKW